MTRFVVNSCLSICIAQSAKNDQRSDIIMKKALLITAIAAVSISAAACSSKKAAETTAAPAETTAAEETSETDVEEDYTSGIITAIDGDIITVKDDYDEQERKYDLSGAEVTKEFPLSWGDWVDLTFPAGTTDDPIPAIAMEVTTSMLEQDMDPVANGKITEVASDSMTLEVDGEEYKILTGNAYVVGKNGIKADENATVEYLGDLDDEPLATKIVMEDAKDSDEAKINAFVGKVAQISEDGNHIVLQAQTDDFFTFVSDSIDFSQYAEGDTVQVQYDGKISDKEIQAVKITKK